ncbi:YfiM family lipoprotein [Serratia rubidaea]|uniref:YfiM family lipoprotein n=1 Tax=Serratia rubidaea TaxID=61652 RepID=UPI001F1BA949|nr:YfiM family lipoprotein [Serratia rubidaea]UJD81483.1 YfiM family lipoprotein [Serratia rubidaea]UJD86046.1 YfiM family lipoprotein [Serratia rubidaea]
MRVLHLCLLIPLLFTSGCSHLANDSWTGKDKAQHFIGSAALAAAGSAYGDHQNWSEPHSRTFGLMFAISIGAAKELYDSREGGTGWSWKDFAWDVAGAAAGYSLYHAAR